MVENFCSFETSYLYWGDYEDVLSCNPGKFDVIFAADVIYEECQVDPLLDTVAALLKGDLTVAMVIVVVILLIVLAAVAVLVAVVVVSVLMVL